MALRAVSMAELRLEVLMEAERSGESVAAVCRGFGISRDTFYQYRWRYLAEGAQRLQDRSRAPLRRPRRWTRRSRRPSAGCAMTIPDGGHAGSEPSWPAPGCNLRPCPASTRPCGATIWSGGPSAPRRPKATRRFVREVSNDLWQIDAGLCRERAAAGMGARGRPWIRRAGVRHASGGLEKRSL